MPVCRDCKFYKSVGKEREGKGTCFGHEVEAKKDASKCKYFKPK